MSNDLANKYRPFKFSEVKGQSSVDKITTSINNYTLGHSLIFCGTRGTGKTTVARIIAAHFNCKTACYPNRMEVKNVSDRRPDDKIPRMGVDIKFPHHHPPEQIEPCGKCPSCRMVRKGIHPSVTEVDAASNTGVDNVRELIDSTRYSTPGGGLRVIILDEAHMLSTNAFNMLIEH